MSEKVYCKNCKSFYIKSVSYKFSDGAIKFIKNYNCKLYRREELNDYLDSIYPPKIKTMLVKDGALIKNKENNCEDFDPTLWFKIKGILKW